MTTLVRFIIRAEMKNQGPRLGAGEKKNEILKNIYETGGA